ncbi:5'-3' exoribonuclease 1-like, partial [Daktulosphaira vitifoliae]|uniref:5'-3' exoribonuclease 1-like n=1 Tax=Daktulosphaira vitifoliae TaxID=58002 RepID=UPI0021AAB9AB
MAEFTLHKENYYRNKLEYNVITEDVMRSQAEGYIRAIQWNLNYYYNGCCSWSWYYPHHYAPYISDIKDFENIQLEFDLGQPFLPFQQLLAVLPSLSKELLPKPFQDLMIEEASPIRMYYPEQFETDLNGKQHEWEAVVLVPFIDEETLLKSMKMVEHKLSDDEKKRNSHGPMYLFKYTKENMGIVSNSKYFPPIQESHAHRILINREDIAVDPNDLVKGLCPNVNLDVYHVGFPTLHLIPITAELLKKGVKVFQSSSLGENMIIKIINQDENIEGNIQSIAKELLGKTVYANWPHLEEIKVTAISSKSLLLSLDDNEHVIVRDMDDSAVQEFKLLSQGFAKTYMSTRGIDIGKTSILLRGQKLKGTKYIPRQDGSGVDLVKAWCEIPSTVAFQTAVLDLEVNDPHIKQSYFALEEYFPVGGNVFVLDAPFYGCQAEVIGGYISSRIKIDITLTPEPYFYDLRDTLNSVSIEMFNANAAAAQLALSPYLLAKLTGTIFLMVDSEEDRHEKKINIGMSLKFNKRNEEVIGYTKKVEKYWLYSQKTIDLLREYLERFPELQNLVNTESTNDTFRIEEMFPDKQTRKEKLEKLKSWISEMRSLTKQKQTFGSMEPCKVAVLEKYMDDFIEINSKHKKIISLNVKSQNLLKPVTKLDKLKADEDADTRVLDRVVCIRSSYQVPLGYKGTVISINKSNVDTETVYCVIFDKEFANGVSLGGSPNRGYKLCRMSFINLSHAIRSGLYKPLVVKVPISQRSNTEKQNTQMSIWEHLQSNSKNLDKISKNTESKFTLASKETWRRQQLQNESNSVMNSNISQKQGQPVEELKKTQSSQNYNNNKSNNSSLLNADACEFTTLALKKMLKIQSEDNSIIKTNSKLESIKSFSSAPSGSSYNSKEQMTENNFSRNNDNSIPYFPAEPSTSMTAALESFYISKGYGTPRYSFTNKVDKNMKLYSASVLLPNGITLPGEVKPTHTEATEDVAARALIIIKKIESNQNKAEQVISNNFSQKINPRLVTQQEIAKQIPQQQAPSNAYMNWISSYPHQSYQQPIPQQSVQYFKGPQIAYQQFQPQQFLAQYAPNYQVPRQSYHLPFVSQPTFTQQNVVSGYSLPSQQYFNYPQEMQYSKPVPTVFPNIVNPAQLPQPPIHWQATPRNVPTANNEILMNPLQQTYQSHTTISHPTYTRSVPKEM